MRRLPAVFSDSSERTFDFSSILTVSPILHGELANLMARGRRKRVHPINFCINRSINWRSWHNITSIRFGRIKIKSEYDAFNASRRRTAKTVTGIDGIWKNSKSYYCHLIRYLFASNFRRWTTQRRWNLRNSAVGNTFDQRWILGTRDEINFAIKYFFFLFFR